MAQPQHRTQRLLLRPFCDADRDAFAALNADPKVMEHFPALLSRVESDALAARAQSSFDGRGHGLWSLELPGFNDPIGYTGLFAVRFSSHFTPCVEIAWRLAHAHWGHGYASEAARALLDVGFREAGLKQVVAFTTVGNVRSQRVMERIGMRRDEHGDFDHPALPEGHRLRRHVLYRIDHPRSER